MIKIKVNEIKQCIKNEGYTNKQFCVNVGITEREFNKILSGDLDFKFVSLVKIARFFSVNVDWLIDFGQIEPVDKFYL